jgi:hypothetical protein
MEHTIEKVVFYKKKSSNGESETIIYIGTEKKTYVGANITNYIKNMDYKCETIVEETSLCRVHYIDNFDKKDYINKINRMINGDDTYDYKEHAKVNKLNGNFDKNTKENNIIKVVFVDKIYRGIEYENDKNMNSESYLENLKDSPASQIFDNGIVHVDKVIEAIELELQQKK